MFAPGFCYVPIDMSSIQQSCGFPLLPFPSCLEYCLGFRQLVVFARAKTSESVLNNVNKQTIYPRIVVFHRL